MTQLKVKDLKEFPKLHEQALSHTKEHWFGDGIEEQEQGLLGAFLWSDTEEGSRFWAFVEMGDFEKAKEICSELFKD